MKPPLEMILPLLLEASILRMVTGTGCSFPLGMELGIIADNQLSASSSWGSSWRPQEARLNNGNAWYPSSYSTSEWLQIDLRERMSITGIQTQGHQYFSTSYYVKSFKLLYSDYGTDSSWNTFQENGSDKIFEGNRNANGVKTNNIDSPIVARFIRLMAVTWKNGIAFRLELLGCELEPTTSIAPLTTETLSTTKVETTVFIPIATSTLKTTTVQQTSPSTAVTTYSVSSTKKTTVTTESITTAVPLRSTSSISSGPGMSSPSSVNSAIIGGAVAAGVVILIIAIVVSIFFIRRRRSKDTDEKESSPQPDETGTVDNIYYGGVTFAANGNASTNGNVSIGQSDGMVDNHLYAYAGTTNGNDTIDQSEGTVDNHLYAGTTNGSVPIDQSEGTVDNHLYAGTGDACLETRHHVGDEGAQENVYYNVAHMSDEGFVENDIYC